MLVFISYAKQDLKYVFWLMEKLKQHQIPLWVEAVDLPLGVNRDTAVEKVLKQATHFLPIISTNSLTSMRVWQQLDLAIATKNVIVPVRIDISALPPQLKRSKSIYLPLGASLQPDAINQLLTQLPSSDETQLPAVKHDLLQEFKLLDSFEWMPISEGKSVDAFHMSKYPVTNAQYNRFIEAGGYDEKQWWTEAGWASRIKGIDFEVKTASWKSNGTGWTQPRYWTDTLWNGAAQPVVGVSWFEALAFCNWLSAVSGNTLLLPTQAQWLRAAQGDDGRHYPWGNQWDCKRCTLCDNADTWSFENSYDPIYTTPVTVFEGQGDSPYGVVDMVGNIWNWTCTLRPSVHTHEPQYALHGGGNVDRVHKAQVTTCAWEVPHYRQNRIGFRCIRQI